VRWAMGVLFLISKRLAKVIQRPMIEPRRLIPAMENLPQSR
jgi:hypothetical protein